MKNPAVNAMTIMTMTVLLSSGMASAADSTPAPDEAAVSADAKVKNDQSPLAKRNAAAKALKAKIEKQNPERTGKPQQQEAQKNQPNSYDNIFHENKLLYKIDQNIHL